MLLNSGGVQTQRPEPNWFKTLSKYGQPSLRKAIWQLLDTLLPYVGLWGLMVYMVHQEYSYWMILVIAVVAAALLVRIFIFFHDCCHGSFFASRRANKILGYISGILTFTPYEAWRYSHARHHATVGDLDRRGIGDVWTMTVAEYLTAPRLKRLSYRIFRNPFVMVGLVPAIEFLIILRFPHKGMRKHEHHSVMFTNLAIVAIIGVVGLAIGFWTYIAIQLPIILIAGTIGVWLFYVQHQFEGAYWARHEVWDPLRASLEGSSYYKLPGVLQWFTGNIGLHHIHHIRPGIPNYRLQECYNGIQALQAVKPLTLRTSLKSLWMNLWDEKRQKMVSFRSLKAISQQGKFKR